MKRAGAGGVNVSIFKSGVRDGRRASGVRFGSNVADAERTRGRIGRAHVARPPDAHRGAITETFLAAMRLVFPVTLLVTAIVAVLIYGGQPARFLGDIDAAGKPFDIAILALPFTFFIVHLTNRRYGGGYAFVQVLATVAVGIAAAMYAADDLTLLRGSALPPSRVIGGFAAALVVAQLFSIVVFDGLRGPRWWQAPLIASLFGGTALALVAYPAIYLGTGIHWLQPMFAYMGLNAASAILMLVPYWLLRPLIAPLPGFGGY